MIWDFLESRDIIGLDTETTGLNPFKDNLLSIQVGDFSEQYILSPDELPKLKPYLLDQSKTFVIHNAQFDLSFFLVQGIRMHNNIFDTMLAERVLTTGTHYRVALDVCLKKYFNIDMDKSVRKHLTALGIHHKDFIEYATKDVKYLPNLMEEQIKSLQEHDLMNCMELENRFVSVLTEIQNAGFKLNSEKWRQKILLDKQDMENNLKELDKIAEDQGIEVRKITETLFGTEEDRLINWSSSAQVIDVFEKLGIKTDIYDKKAKRVRKSVQEKHIVKRINENPIVSAYIKYQKSAKLLSTYGLNYLEELDKYPDGRLRTKFDQIKNTGRLSSGSGKVNFQNIPRVSEKRTREIYERECFEPEKGNMLITADYSSQESRILASISQDKKLLDFYNSGEADLHSYAVKLVYGHRYPELKEMNLDQVKEKFPEERRRMKGFNFALTLAPCYRKVA